MPSAPPAPQVALVRQAPHLLQLHLLRLTYVRLLPLQRLLVLPLIFSFRLPLHPLATPSNLEQLRIALQYEAIFKAIFGPF